jgi:hypothetical protein
LPRIDGSVFQVWGAILQLDGDLNQVDSMLAHSEKALEVFPNQGMFWYFERNCAFDEKEL